ncbi:oligosaccharide flippase family protein [Tsuneonella sp. SYSU-LHT278]|uniref:oligosaccharide flippase family protein n=1 Tax=Tsuneonella sediminis TaxID=3416089 RepID=UPI003F790DDD
MTGVASPAAAGNGMNRGKLYMLAATIARMSAGLITFILLARYLGPVQFGLIATAIAYATFAGIASDYGLSTYALRNASADREEAARIVGEALAVKTLLSVSVFALCAALFAAVLSPFDTSVYALVFAGALAASFADLALVGVRAQQRFDIEAKLVVAASVFWMLVVGGVAALTLDVLASAAAFAATRIGYLLVVMIALRGWIDAPARWRRSATQLRTTLSGASAYAADSVLTTVSGQIDILVLGLSLAAYEMGIYQAGARLVQVIVPFAVVLSTVYLPAMAGAVSADRKEAYSASRNRLTLEFTVIAILAGLGFAMLGPLVSRLLYGDSYDALFSLWPGFAVFVIFRFTAAAYGIQLVAIGRIRPRIIAQVASIAMFVLSSLILLPTHRLEATSWLLALSSLVTFVILAGAVLSRGGGGRVLWGAAALTLLAAILISLFAPR